MLEATSGRAWVEAMLEFEVALARAEAAAGVIPADAAATIAQAARQDFDVEAIARHAAATANPAAPLVRDLAAAAGEAGGWVHWGATSQDAVDTAMMLIVRRALDILLADVDRATTAAARLARDHRATAMAARTLLQQAAPTTFGLKAAGWLEGLLAGRRQLIAFRAERPSVQLGGAAGTLAALGERGLAVAEGLAAELGMAAPRLPWHTERSRLAELGGLLAGLAGTAGKVAQDVVLLAQTEVAEVAEGGPAGHGGSSTLPQKRNPAGSVLALSASRSAQSACGLLLAAQVQEHERAAGWWQLEGEALTHALRYTAGAVEHVAGVLEGLEVDTARMRANLDRAGGLVMAESVTMCLAAVLGRPRARALVEAVAARARGGARGFRDELLAEPEVAEALAASALDAALAPENYLGAAQALVDRALDDYRSSIGRQP